MTYRLTQNTCLKFLQDIFAEYDICDSLAKSMKYDIIFDASEESLLNQNINNKGDRKTTEKECLVGMDINKIGKLNIPNFCSIDDLYDFLKKSSFCKIKELSHNTVLYDGNVNAKIMLIGEAPGEEEDLSGVPFCGRSGRLLDNILLSIGLSRKDNIYITNTLFWRPPANRKPSPEEISACRPFVMAQINIIKPKFIILCGATATECITGVYDIKMSNYRGKIFDTISDSGYKCKASSIYHPSYLLRNPSAKKIMWSDMIMIQEYLKKVIPIN